MRNANRLLDVYNRSRLCELVDDGNLLTYIQDILVRADTAKVTKVEGHQDDDMARMGPVRAMDENGGDRADAAAVTNKGNSTW